MNEPMRDQPGNDESGGTQAGRTDFSEPVSGDRKRAADVPDRLGGNDLEESHGESSQDDRHVSRAGPDLEVTPLEKAGLQWAGLQMVLSQWSSSLPPPEVLAAYAAVSPEIIPWLLSSGREESEHRRSHESEDLRTRARLSLVGMCLAFALGAMCIIGGVAAVLHGEPVAGSFLGGLGLTSILAPFLRTQLAKDPRDGEDEEDEEDEDDHDEMARTES